MRCPVSGACANPFVLADGQSSTSRLAIDAKSVYWINAGTQANNYTDGVLAKCDIVGCGGQPTMLAPATVSAYSAPAPVGLAADGTNVYWTEAGSVLACAAQGCNNKPTTLASGQWGGGGIAVDATNVYFVGSSIMKCPLAGCGNSPPMTVAPWDNQLALTIDATTVYAAQNTGNSTSKIQECPKSGCASLTLLVDHQQHPMGIAVDTTNVYWSASGATLSDAGVKACAIGGCGNTPTILSTVNSLPSGGIAIDATAVYWGSVDQNGTVGSILKVAKP
jgi:hypothetical protein